jgi:PAS domain S-box-containing protein
MLAGVILIHAVFIARRIAEAALRESEATYRGILDNMIDAFIRTGADGRIMIISPSACDMFGYSMDELTGSSVGELYLRAADREELLGLLKASGGRVQSYATAFRHKDAAPFSSRSAPAFCTPTMVTP